MKKAAFYQNLQTVKQEHNTENRIGTGAVQYA